MKAFFVFLFVLLSFGSASFGQEKPSKNKRNLTAPPTHEVVVPTPTADWCKEVTLLCSKDIGNVTSVHGAKIQGFDKVETKVIVENGLTVTAITQNGKKTLHIPEEDLRKHVHQMWQKDHFLVMDAPKAFRP